MGKVVPHGTSLLHRLGISEGVAMSDPATPFRNNVLHAIARSPGRRAVAAAQRNKETTLGQLAHEIRQPIQVIDTCLEILEHTTDGATADNAVRRARRSV